MRPAEVSTNTRRSFRSYLMGDVMCIHGVQDGPHVREMSDAGPAQRCPIHRIHSGHLRQHPPAVNGEHHVVAMRALRHGHWIGPPIVADYGLDPEPQGMSQRIVWDAPRPIKGRGLRHTSKLPPPSIGAGVIGHPTCRQLAQCYRRREVLRLVGTSRS